MPSSSSRTTRQICNVFARFVSTTTAAAVRPAFRFHPLLLENELPRHYRLKEFRKVLKKFGSQQPEELWSSYVSIGDPMYRFLRSEYHSLVLRSCTVKGMVAYGPNDIETMKSRIEFVLGKMRAYGYKLTVMDYDHLIEFYGKANDWDACTRYWEELQQQAQQPGLWTLRPSVYTYNHYMQAAVACNKPEMALEIYKQLRKQDGMEPTLCTYDTLMEAYGRMGEPHEALKLFRKLFEPDNNKSTTMTDKSKNWLSMFSITKDMPTTPQAARAAPLHHLMPRSGNQKQKPSARTFVALIHAYGRQGDMKQMRYISDRLMEKHKVSWNLDVCNALIRWHCEHKEIESARRVFFAMDRAKIKPNVATFKYFIRYTALREKKPGKAEALMNYMTMVYKIQPLQSMYRALIKRYNERKKPEQADRIYNEYILGRQQA